jgi:NADPH:quinone reductase
MRAFAADKFGDIEVLTLRELPTPKPGPRQVLVHIKAAAINAADLKVLGHRDGGSFLHASKFPLVLGFDFSGVVTEVGADVGGERKVGDEVYGFLPYSRRTRTGTFAEYVAVDVSTIGRKPASLSHEDAAAAATTASTGLQMLRDKGRFASGTVLIHGASGGVGTYAVQIAKALGANVVATTSATKLDYVRQLGADRVVDYKTTRLRDLEERFAVILDCGSMSSYGECAPILARGGAYVTTLPTPGAILGMARAMFSSKRCSFLVVQPRTSDLDQLATWFEAGKLRSNVEQIFPFSELPAALLRQRSGGVRGKLAITIE